MCLRVKLRGGIGVGGDADVLADDGVWGCGVTGEICDAEGASQAAGFGARGRGIEGAGAFVAKGAGGMEAPH